MADRLSLFTRRAFMPAAVAGVLNGGTLHASTKEKGIATSNSVPILNVREFGATGDGQALDSPAINRALEEAAKRGGGMVYFPAGHYLCYSLRLKSNVALYLDAGAVIVGASVPPEGTATGGYDAAGPAQPWEAFQDYGHNHWRNSLLWGEDIHNFSIAGPGLIWGKGLSRGDFDELPHAESSGVGNKAISLKNCRNVKLQDFSILAGGHFAILLTGVDNVTISGLTIDTNRDGMDIDCCRNVHVTQCSVNSPWDDAIVLKSSFALGYARSTDNVTISDCYVTGIFDYGTLLNGTFKRMRYPQGRPPVGRIKCGTESNGGFRNITITNCVFEGCRGLAIESVDGAIVEDITISNITMRDLVQSPIFLRLGTRMRGPAGAVPGTMRRILIQNIVSSGAVAEYPSVIAGVAGHPIEDIKISDVYLQQLGGGDAKWGTSEPPEKDAGYPEASMFGKLPARGFFIRHARNLEFTNIEIAEIRVDLRPAIWVKSAEDIDIFRLRTKPNIPAFTLEDVQRFRSFGSRNIPDRTEDVVRSLSI